MGASDLFTAICLENSTILDYWRERHTGTSISGEEWLLLVDGWSERVVGTTYSLLVKASEMGPEGRSGVRNYMGSILAQYEELGTLLQPNLSWGNFAEIGSSSLGRVRAKLNLHRYLVAKLTVELLDG